MSKDDNVGVIIVAERDNTKGFQSLPEIILAIFGFSRLWKGGGGREGEGQR